MSVGNRNVAVLLSTFNGEVYIREQMESLLSQKCNLKIDIHIRDDGSTDNTLQILKAYNQKCSNVHIYEGDNVGVIGSFLWLVSNITNYTYYAFCDQDDIWEPLKLIAAVNKFEKNTNSIPLLYCSAYDYVDQRLNFIGRFQTSSDLSANNLLIENCAPGCTMVFNSLLRDKFLSLDIKNLSNRIVMHDWFLLLLGIGFGKVLYDNNSYLLYRQHENNVIGKKTGLIAVMKSKIKQFRKERKRPQHLLFSQCEVILEYCSEDKSNKLYNLSNQFVTSQKNIISRFVFVLNGNVKRVIWIDDVIFKILFIAGYYK